jgi:hypothetical protein
MAAVRGVRTQLLLSSTRLLPLLFFVADLRLDHRCDCHTSHPTFDGARKVMWLALGALGTISLVNSSP